MGTARAHPRPKSTSNPDPLITSKSSPATAQPELVRVLHVLEATLGGTGRVVPALARAQSLAGAAVGFAYSRTRADDGFLRQLATLPADGVECFECQMWRNPLPWRDVQSAGALIQIVKQFRPDILHLHASKAGMLGRLLYGFRRRPLVVYQPHGFSYLRRGPMYSMLYRTAEVATARLVDVCLVVSSAERDAATHGPLGWPTQMEVVPNIVEITPADAARAREIRKALGVKDGERIALYLGRLAAGKRIDDLIRAVQQVRAAGHRWHAVIAGEGALRRPLEELARGNGLGEFIHFGGFQQETQNWIAAADCLVHPSSFEAFGVAVAEAMMVGRAVIASDIPSMRELIEPGVTGVLYPCGNVTELGNRLIALSTDPALIVRMGRAGLERSDRFSAKPVAAAHIAVYLHLLKGEG